MLLVELSKVLSEERTLLEQLRFKLEEVQLVATAGRHEWLARATDELQEALMSVQWVEERRLEVSAVTASSLGLHPDATIEDLAKAAPEPWGEVIGSHRGPLTDLLAETEQCSLRCRRVLATHLDVTQRAMTMLGDVPGQAYGVDGIAQPRRRSQMVNQVV
ncbi:MAG: flagellar export chaperone FlgN [Actinomycetota bacterium]|nr:flagellar export chaperone FlgN [Actinomycetota bacterium]